MAIRLYDSLTRELRELKPSQPDGVFRMYCCGPTVYAPAHIGNFRTFLVQDVLRRLLELEFGAGKVKHVRNLTDVDDRTIAQAKREKRPLTEITKKWTDKFHDDCRALNLLLPHVEPTATGHIAEQVAMINELLAKGLAYVTPNGSVYYKIAAFPGYGALSRIKERVLKATVTGADDDHKDDASDFALWKAYKPDEDGDVRWPGPRGAAEGRPGWHIECSAMSRKHLGDTIDLHAGGVDLLFPHHENEIAQSEGCTNHTFSRHWYHSEFLLVDGRKMSKSLGNLYTLADLKKIMGPTFNPIAVRFALMQGHPRKQLNFVTDSMFAAVEALSRLTTKYDVLKTWAKAPDSKPRSRSKPSDRFDGVIAALQNDLNFPEALGVLFEMGRQEERRDPAGDLLAFERAVRALGLKLRSSISLEDDHLAVDLVEVFSTPTEITALADKRWAARQAKDFATADALRKELAAAGWSMLDGKDGYKLEPLKK
ncbi:MAG: cysteine--tRNA ligase [Opitutaceae bacterium]|nr:cysteine--tRNA ligase [Opitutaceae bacterium]